MVIFLGQDPWILIGLTFLELLFLIIPPFIAAKVERTSLKEQLVMMRFQAPSPPYWVIGLKAFIGGVIGMLLYLVGGYIAFFYQVIIVTILGSQFLESGESGAISTQPTQPNLVQLSIILVLQVAIVAVSEEAFFRSFLIQKLQTRFRLYLSIIFSSIFFALYHVPPFLVPITTVISFFGFYFTFGILLSVLFIAFDYQIIPVILCHGVYNILVILF